jgi:hypothetical protein
MLRRGAGSRSPRRAGPRGRGGAWPGGAGPGGAGPGGAWCWERGAGGAAHGPWRWRAAGGGCYFCRRGPRRGRGRGQGTGRGGRAAIFAPARGQRCSQHEHRRLPHLQPAGEDDVQRQGLQVRPIPLPPREPRGPPPPLGPRPSSQVLSAGLPRVDAPHRAFSLSWGITALSPIETSPFPGPLPPF